MSVAAPVAAPSNGRHRHRPDGPAAAPAIGSAAEPEKTVGIDLFEAIAMEGPATTPVAGVPSGIRLARVLSALVAAAAGLVGVAMLVSPDATGSFFSWDLGSAPLAALVGGCYVASAAIFGWAAFREPWSSLRPLCIAVFGLSVPTLLATSQHLAVFDFGRWQAIAWVGLFLGSVAFFGLTLAITRSPIPSGGPVVRDAGRVALATVAAAYALLAVVLWVRPEAVAELGPIDAGPLGLRFVGSWAAFLALLAAGVVVRPRWAESRLALAALVTWPLVALAVALPHLDALRAGAPTWVYLAALPVLAGVPGATLASTLRARSTASPDLRRRSSLDRAHAA